jgi:hypothetical protein
MENIMKKHTAAKCQAKDPSTCPYHGSTSSAAISRGDVNAFIDAKDKEKKEIVLDSSSSFVSDKDAKNVFNEILKTSGNLNEKQTLVADTVSKMYESGDLESSVAKLIKVETKVPEIVKDGKTIGIIKIGNEGNAYFYETDGKTVVFRQGDGYDIKGEKLPWNYGMRKKLDGKGITENNIKWGAEAMLARYGF